MRSCQGTITDLHSLSTHDGPGLRTTVFFKGCPLRCAWCQNPETIDPRPHLEWTAPDCVHCGACMEACRDNLIEIGADKMACQERECSRCGACSAACPTGALMITGREVSPAELLKEVEKDAVFFRNSGGGVTMSGGEPLFQADFATRFAALCRAQGISIALDTCGAVPLETIETILPFIDLLLFDIKIMDSDAHRKCTSQSNQTILDNLKAILRRPTDELPNIWIRTPLIPGATANAENIAAIANFLLDNWNDSVQLWELCAFNNLCRDRYRRMGIEWSLDDMVLMKDYELDGLLDTARAIVAGRLEVKTAGMTSKG